MHAGSFPSHYQESIKAKSACSVSVNYLDLGKSTLVSLVLNLISKYMAVQDLHREQADTGRETLSRGLWEKLGRGISQRGSRNATSVRSGR